MQGMYRQRGMTAISLVVLLAMIGFFVLIALRLFPIYLEHFKVVSHLEGFASEPNHHKFTDAEIHKSLRKRFDIDDVEHVTAEDIFIERPDRNTLIIAIEYEVRTAAIGNVDMIVSFVDEVEVRP